SGNSSDQVSLLAAVEALQEQLRAPETAEEAVYVADGAISSVANMTRLNAPPDPLDQSGAGHLGRGQSSAGLRCCRVAAVRRWAHLLVEPDAPLASRGGALFDRAHPGGRSTGTGEGAARRGESPSLSGSSDSGI